MGSHTGRLCRLLMSMAILEHFEVHLCSASDPSMPVQTAQAAYSSSGPHMSCTLLHYET